ncbi:Crp/Fnr family transcriptional regulator [Flavihumibacter petaseus]|uniref:Cyclic nucleotide-binding domain-containing protein n=1 Tax=Flavihumibacter petaseus NBRC 106054 TaxID=1220578 RepID=A0A0E9N727_9BACT|nr:Crp/Fnr family transcriptional regulator [Flavihumibacter petaseus]GAO45150.1 hypothetical protein FPE01S_04_03930 [Flavihumibacter petaseus NBRC 106054]
MEKLTDQLRRWYALTPEMEAALQQSFSRLIFNRNDYLAREGRVCRDLYFIDSGAARGFYHLDGREITHWFSWENDFVTSFHSFITEQPAVENIQLLEGSVLWGIQKDKLMELLDRFQEMERLLRKAYESYYIRLEERFVNAQFKTAAERYEELLLDSPHVLERASLGQVASYLGMSQETLSRIRGKS